MIEEVPLQSFFLFRIVLLLYWVILNRKCAAHTFSVYNYFDSNEKWFHAVRGERKIYKHAFT